MRHSLLTAGSRALLIVALGPLASRSTGAKSAGARPSTSQDVGLCYQEGAWTCVVGSRLSELGAETSRDIPLDIPPCTHTHRITEAARDHPGWSPASQSDGGRR